MPAGCQFPISAALAGPGANSIMSENMAAMAAMVIFIFLPPAQLDAMEARRFPTS
jgi:hypothetical protein